MGICYGQIGSVLWGKGIVRENACNDLAHERKLMSKRKVRPFFINTGSPKSNCSFWVEFEDYRF